MTSEDEAKIKRMFEDLWREKSRLWFTALYGDCPELKALETMATIERNSGRINSTPLSLRLHVDQKTAWRWLKRWVEGGWVSPMLAKSGKRKRVLGWLLTEKARFALVLSTMTQ